MLSPTDVFAIRNSIIFLGTVGGTQPSGSSTIYSCNFEQDRLRKVQLLKTADSDIG